ncbi:MAG: hypothetical protein V1646_04800 [bacterium]
MIEKIKNFFIKIATLNSLGNWFFGGVISALLAIPFLYILQFLYNKFPYVFHSIWLGVVLLCLVSIYIALKEFKSSIVLHKFVGVMIAFYCVPLTLKIAFSGIILFYLWDFLIPMVIFKNHDADQLGRIKQIFYLIIPAIASGIIVNAFLHLVLWIAH